MNRLLTALSGVLLLTLLAACGQGPTGDPQPDPRPGANISNVHFFGGSGPAVLAVGLGMVDTDYEPPEELGPLSVTDIGDGFYIGPVTGFEAGEAFTVPYPAAADVPAVTRSPATSFLTFGGTECVTTSTNAAARVSEVLWMLISFPAMVGIGPEGISPSIASNTDLSGLSAETDLFGLPLVTWVYATAPTEVATPEAGCSVGDFAVHVDLALDQGWNQLEFVVHPDATDPTEVSHVTLSNSDIEDLHITFLSGI